MKETAIHVIATTISGSIADWGKIERIVPLFASHGRTDVALHTSDSHAGAQALARDLAASGARTLISAGGSGTFNSVLQGCIDSGVEPGRITLGFLRKGSADLLGKALGMPDEIEEAVRIFAASLAAGRRAPCDIILAASAPAGTSRHFVGYGGAEIFGRIPHFTENRLVKYYKGVLGQVFGDLGPFRVGVSMALAEKVMWRILGRRPRQWTINVDGREAARGRFQAMLITNGDLGPDMPFAAGNSLGSGRFHLFAFRDLGLARLPAQLRSGFSGRALREPRRFGFEAWEVSASLRLSAIDGGAFPVNADGFTLPCRGSAEFRIVGQMSLIAA